MTPRIQNSQEMSESQIIHFQDNPNQDLIRRFVVGYTPTVSDLQRKLSTDELKELCGRVKCRVDLTRWNPAYDCLQYFKQNGYLKNKREKKVEKLMLKAVNRYKNVNSYKDEDIQSELQREWAYRKKENLLRLDLWAYDRERALIQAQVDAQSSQYHETDRFEEINTDNMIVAHEEEIITLSENISGGSQAEAGSLHGHLPNNFSHDVSQVMGEFMNLNTESLTVSEVITVVSSESYMEVTPSEPVANVVSQNILSTGYEEFNNFIPLTSTQSQK